MVFDVHITMIQCPCKHVENKYQGQVRRNPLPKIDKY